MFEHAGWPVVMWLVAAAEDSDKVAQTFAEFAGPAMGGVLRVGFVCTLISAGIIGAFSLFVVTAIIINYLYLALNRWG